MKNKFIAASADVFGDVVLGEESSIWFQSVLRGDSASITVGKGTNVQDGTVVHTDLDVPVVLGDYITIGHQCLIHGCTVKDGALIGMGSILLNHSVIGENTLIGAGSLVTEGTVIPPNVLAFGRPAKVIRPLTTEEIQKNRTNAEHYIELAQRYLAGEIPQKGAETQ